MGGGPVAIATRMARRPMDDSRNLPDRRRRGSRRAAVLLAATVLALLPEHGAYAATWSMTPTPNASQQRNLFTGVDAVNTTNAWAVGYFDAATAPWQRPLAARWNGTQWTLASPPTPSSGGWLNGVDGSAATSVWAVGAAGSTALIQRWNGTAWSTAPSPIPAGATSTVLNGVRTFGANSAWAVGNAVIPGANPASRTLIQRWNGTRWSIVPSPSPDSTQNLLVAVDGVTANDVWAVGNLGHDGYGGGTVAGLVLHWNGSTWTKAAIPGADSTFSIITLRDVVAPAANNVWVVGSAFHRQLFREVPYLLHWNGQTWRHSTLANPPAAAFHSLTALSATKVYAVGTGGLVARWSDNSWTRETTPAGSSTALLAASATGTGTVWAVGWQTNTSGTLRTMAMRTSNG
jgi:hypothetical protein